MLKRICVVVSMCVALSIVRIAAAEQMTIHSEYDFKTDRITVTGSIPDGRYRLVLLQVLGPLYEENSSVTVTNASDVIFYTDDVVAQKDGSYCFEFGLNGGATGTYTFKAATADPSVFASTTLECVNEQDIENMLDKINSAEKWENVAELFENKKAAATLGLNTKVYKTVKNRDLIYQQIFSEKTKALFIFAEIGRLEKTFETYSVLAKINESNDAESLMKENSELLGYMIENSGTAYTFNTILDDEGRKLVYAAHNNGNFASPDELKQKFAQTTVLYAVARNQWQALDTIVEKNTGILENINYEKYKTLKSPGEAAARITNVLYSSVEDFVAKFNEETDLQYKSENSHEGAVGGGGIGGGGSASGGTTVKSTIVPQTPVILPDKYDDVSFSDLEDTQWAVEAINFLKEKDVISGKGNGIFAPNDYVTREEFVKMIVLALGMHNQNVKSTFADVPEEHWSSSYIRSAVDCELITGIDANRFGLGDTISRQDMSVIIYRAIVKKTGKTGNSEAKISFDDSDDIAGYAREAVEKLYGMGIINGVSETTFAPLDKLTRAQAAKVIYEVVK